ncbi:MAG TPA: SprB repeat-containing protein, partial [Saprospiraceae bacterium]|nr:SprB repeat-containing protein [Saprospiraceae bacterium]
ISSIYQDRLSRMWVGTDQGLMYGPPGRWKADFANYNVQRVREYNTVIYVLADGEISKAPNGDKWSDLAVESKQIEGDINDFDIDSEGKMWIVSGVLTRFDLTASTYDVFSGPEYYTSQYGTCVAVTAEGAAWVGTDDKGLFMVDKAYSMTLNAYVDQPITCEGNGKDAVLLAKVTGGVPPYTYAWSGGLSGEKPANVGAGTYTVTVTDSKGKARSAEVPVYDVRLKIKARQKKPESGPGKADGSAEVDIATNASGIQIKWDNGELMAVATRLSTGQHTVTVTDPKGCAVTATVTIGEKAAPLSVSISEKSPLKCAGDKNAALSTQAAGGKAPYKYAWSNPAFSGENPGAVPAGDYTLTLTDAAGATTTAAISIKQPDPLSITATATAPASTGQADGKALVQAKGGTGVYLFKWDDGETTYTVSRLAVGQHGVTVTDANGCTASASVNISENIMPLTVRLIEKTPIRCPGDKNAALVAQVNGGKAPFKYTWANAAASGDQASNLAAGTYIVTVTDLAGNTASATLSLKAPEGFGL